MPSARIAARKRSRAAGIGVELLGRAAGPAARRSIRNSSRNGWLANSSRPSRRRTITSGIGWASAMLRNRCSLARSAASARFSALRSRKLMTQRRLPS